MLSPTIIYIAFTIAVVNALLSIYLFLSYKRQKKLAQDIESAAKEQTLQQTMLQERFDQQNQQLIKITEQKQQLQQELQDLFVIKGQVDQLKSQLTLSHNQLEQKELNLDDCRQKITVVEKQNAELQQLLENERTNAGEKIALLENAKKQLSDEFSVLANKIFEQKQTQFTQTSQAAVEATLKPMQSVLNDFKTRVETVHKEDVEGRASLTEQLKQLQQLNTQMSEEAHNLTQALKGDNKTQGNWGELILQRLLERSGLTEGVEFEREKSFTDEKGKRLRPDVIINMPDNKHIIIDSKVSLSDYERALNAPTDADRTKFTKAHLASLKKHIAALASKRYDHLEQLNPPDFVLMFVPVEGAYMIAIESDSGIFEGAFASRVAVVTPTTLFTTLKTVEQLWRYERQSENTVKLIKRAAEVHDKFVGFVETFEKVGSQFATAESSYQKARNQLIQGQGNLIRQAEMLKDLAGKTKKEIPSHLLDEAEGLKIESKD